MSARGGSKRGEKKQLSSVRGEHSDAREQRTTIDGDTHGKATNNKVDDNRAINSKVDNDNDRQSAGKKDTLVSHEVDKKRSQASYEGSGCSLTSREEPAKKMNGSRNESKDKSRGKATRDKIRDAPLATSKTPARARRAGVYRGRETEMEKWRPSRPK